MKRSFVRRSILFAMASAALSASTAHAGAFRDRVVAPASPRLEFKVGRGDMEYDVLLIGLGFSKDNSRFAFAYHEHNGLADGCEGMHWVFEIFDAVKDKTLATIKATEQRKSCMGDETPEGKRAQAFKTFGWSKAEEAKIEAALKNNGIELGSGRLSSQASFEAGGAKLTYSVEAKGSELRLKRELASKMQSKTVHTYKAPKDELDYGLKMENVVGVWISPDSKRSVAIVRLGDGDAPIGRHLLVGGHHEVGFK